MMGSLTSSRKFDPLDLEMLDRVYALACLYIEADNLCRTTEKDTAREQDALRKQIFILAGTGPVDFDTLCDEVLASMEEYKTVSRAGSKGTKITH
jgi:hypothetical protein